MADQKDDARDLCLAPNEWACVLDKTNGNVYLYVGPKQDQLAQTIQPVLFNDKTKSFDRGVELSKAIQKAVIASEGSYVVLENPSKKNDFPGSASRSVMPELDMGRKINIPGPVSFAPWPGQTAKVLPGHTLRSNQYLVVRVYDQAAARANWKDATIEKAPTDDDKKTSGDATLTNVKADTLVNGQLLIIRGTSASFFIPPTGLEVAPNEKGELVRDAVTLERLDYCVLKDEKGDKRIERGPQVVFPDPTEVFLTQEVNGEETRRFRAFELSETSGIYVKVTDDYEEGDKKYTEGEELFITGNEQRLYIPRNEHMPIKYGNQEVYYATAIPGGEGRYVLDRLTGVIETVKGPTQCLPDPRTKVFIRRILSEKLCGLLYPGNTEAIAHNRSLKRKVEEEAAAMLYSNSRSLESAPIAAAGPAGMRGFMGSPGVYASSVSNSMEGRGLGGAASTNFAGDTFDRAGRYTEPRSVTIDSKYEGALRMKLFTNFAICLVKPTGETRVEVGPQNVLADYDEDPQTLRLSTGKPKNMDKVFETPYLQVKENKISDIFEVETRDYVKVQIKLAYRVDFIGDEPKKWFAVENYVKLLCDHMRSRHAAAVKRLPVEPFYLEATDRVRDIVLGTKIDENTARKGFTFEANNMHVYDVEVLEVKILDTKVEASLVAAQREGITQQLDLANRERLLHFTERNETITRDLATETAKTKFASLTLAQETIKQQLEHDLADIIAKAKAATERHTAELAAEKAETEIAEQGLARTHAQAESELEIEEARQKLFIEKLTAETEALAKRMEAITPDFIGAITAFSDKALIEKLGESLSPMALLGGTSIADVIGKALAGTKLAAVVPAMLSASNGNGASKGGGSTTASA
jgi:major vault protein